MATEPKYRGFFKSANEPETDKWIEVFASDWGKEFFAFYAYIDVQTYKKDLEAINKLISELNYVDGDVYVELIDHSGQKDVAKFYDWLYSEGYFSDWAALCPENWDEWWNGRGDEDGED